MTQDVFQDIKTVWRSSPPTVVEGYLITAVRAEGGGQRWVAPLQSRASSETAALRACSAGHQHRHPGLFVKSADSQVNPQTWWIRISGCRIQESLYLCAPRLWYNIKCRQTSCTSLIPSVSCGKCEVFVMPDSSLSQINLAKGFFLLLMILNFFKN